MASETPRVDRRKFVKYSLAGAGAAGIAGAAGYAAWRSRSVAGSVIVEDRPGIVDPKAGVEARRRLGRTELRVSPVAIGAGGLDGPEPIIRAVDKGMNYIDTSICYGSSELVIGRALRASRGLREKLIIATKWDSGHKSTRAEITQSLDKSLKRLGVDHVDIMQLHWLGGGHTFPDDGFNRLDNPELYRAMEDAKKAGKVRFFGATSHAGDRAAILKHAIDKGAFDMLLVKMNVLDYESANLPDLLRHAKAKDVGVVVMKSQPGGGRIPAGFEKSNYSIFQANLRWVLDHDEVACVVHSKIGTDAAHQDLAAGAIATRLSDGDRALLRRYAEALSPEYCRGCSGACTDACPAGVAVPYVVQFDMYDRRYGWRDRAREHYHALPVAQRWSDLCLTCNECTRVCPYGFDAASVVNAARERLG